MGMISKIIQKIEGYDWEEGHDFEVISVTDDTDGRYEVTLRQMNEKDRNPVETLINRLRAYSIDKEIFAIVGIKQAEVPYQWHVELVVDKNDGYVSTEEKEEKDDAETGK